MIKYRRKMLCFNPWDRQKFKKVKSSYQTRRFKKSVPWILAEFMESAEATNGTKTASAQPQTTPQPVSVGQTHLGQSLCVLWCRRAVHRVVVWVLEVVFALAPH